jgi:hypothetical protein
VSAVVAAGMDELVPVRVLSFATSRFARRNDPAAAVDGNRERALQDKKTRSHSGRRRSLQGLGQDISPLFRAADRSRPNLGVGFRFGVETFRQRTDR